MVTLAVAILAAFLQPEFISAVAGRDHGQSVLAERAAGQRPDLSFLAALRADARYDLRQLRRRQPQAEIERKRLGAPAGVAIAVGVLGWLLSGPA